MDIEGVTKTDLPPKSLDCFRRGALGHKGVGKVTCSPGHQEDDSYDNQKVKNRLKEPPRDVSSHGYPFSRSRAKGADCNPWRKASRLTFLESSTPPVTGPA